MNLKVAEFQTEGYQVNTPVYEGPLDLLLDLINRAELDITTLALAQVTDQYLEHIKVMQHKSPSEVSAFLVIAARLVQIKSAALLPKPQLTDQGGADEEDPGEALARQLILYKRFKEIAGSLKGRQKENLRTHLRVAPMQFEIEPKLDMSGIDLDMLVNAAKIAFGGKMNLPELSQVVNMPRVTIREKIQILLTTLKSKSKSTFKSMLGSKNRVEVVVTFLALLELIKRHIVEANQDDLFGSIEFQAVGDIEETELTDIEFDE